jgi:putative membrane protein
MTVFFAFLHHIAAFALVAALTVELALINGDLTVRSARKIQLYDMVLGIAALVVLVAGLLRVFYFEKGADYYFHNLAFILKFALFVIVALLSIYPTVQFQSWRKALQQGQTPSLEDHKLKRLRLILHLELTSVVLIILCAALMTRGIGSFP